MSILSKFCPQVLLGLFFLAIVACVPKNHYDALNLQNTETQTALSGAKRALESCQQAQEASAERLTLLEEQNQTLRNTNQILSKKNVMLSNEMLEVRGKNLEERKETEEKQRALEFASQTYDDLVSSLKAEVEERKVTIEEMKDQLKVSLVERLVFPAGQVELNPEGKAVLDKVAKILKTIKGKRIQVEGHSDSSAPAASQRDTYPSNWEISSRRATAVVRYLQDKGVNPTWMAAVGLAHYHPIADNKTAQGRQTNRRIEIVLTPLPKLEPLGKP